MRQNRFVVMAAVFSALVVSACPRPEISHTEFVMVKLISP
jgi:hypothetical protein